jgi:type I restriction enzyme, S subunit
VTDIMTRASPQHWQLYRLGQLFRERKEKGSDKDFPPLSVTMGGIVPQLETAAKTDDGDNRKVVRVGDYVINSRSDRKGSGGVSEYEGSVSLISIVLEPRNIDPRFAHHLLRSPAFQEEFYRWGHGIVADLWTTRYGDMKNIRLRVPDLATQRQIADFLDRETARIDLLIEKKQRLVALLGEKYEATAAQLSTGERSQEDKFDSGIDWLGSIPESWSVEKLSWHFYAAKGKDAQKYTKEYCGENEGEFPVYSGQTANEGVMGRIGTYDYDFGETGVLFATTVGAKAMDLRHLQGKFSLSQNCMIIIPRQQIPLKFYLYQMRVLFRKERQLIPDHMQASFRVEDLYRYRIAVPPLDHASDVGAKIEKAEAALKAVVEPVNASIDRLKEYRSALITAAVTGQIEVSTYAKSGTPDRRLDAIQEEMGA